MLAKNFPGMICGLMSRPCSGLFTRSRILSTSPFDLYASLISSLLICAGVLSLKNVFFEGFVPNEKIGQYLAVGDVFVLLSSAEPFGLAVNEAMIFDNALILSPTCGCASDLLIEGQNGYLVRESDPLSVEKALYSLVSDRETLERFKKKSGEIIEKWGPSQAAEGVVQALTYIRSSKKHSLS